MDNAKIINFDDLTVNKQVCLFRTTIAADDSVMLKQFLKYPVNDDIFLILRSDNIIRLVFHYKSIKCFRLLVRDGRLNINVDNNYALIYAINNDLKLFMRELVDDIRLLKNVYPSMLRFKYFSKLLHEKFNVDNDEDVMKCIQLL